MKVVATIILFLVCTYPPQFSYAYGTEVHKKLNEIATFREPLTNLLSDDLKLLNGVRTAINGKEVIDWIRDGGEREDDWYEWYMDPHYLAYRVIYPSARNTRGYHHYHNPLWLWDDAYFSDPTWEWAYFSLYLSHPYSTVLWVLENRTNKTPPQQADIALYENTGDWSWNQVRNYYYLALTDDTELQKNWANCFRGLGQIMHTIQDMSLPEHTRNDGHPIGRTYEEYINRKYGETKDHELTFLDQFNSVPPSEALLTDPRGRNRVSNRFAL